jgi:hypothetical protein
MGVAIGTLGVTIADAFNGTPALGLASVTGGALALVTAGSVLTKDLHHKKRIIQTEISQKSLNISAAKINIYQNHYTLPLIFYAGLMPRNLLALCDDYWYYLNMKCFSFYS